MLALLVAMKNGFLAGDGEELEGDAHPADPRDAQREEV